MLSFTVFYLLFSLSLLVLFIVVVAVAVVCCSLLTVARVHDRASDIRASVSVAVERIEPGLPHISSADNLPDMASILTQDTDIPPPPPPDFVSVATNDGAIAATAATIAAADSLVPVSVGGASAAATTTAAGTTSTAGAGAGTGSVSGVSQGGGGGVLSGGLGSTPLQPRPMLRLPHLSLRVRCFVCLFVCLSVCLFVLNAYLTLLCDRD